MKRRPTIELPGHWNLADVLDHNLLTEVADKWKKWSVVEYVTEEVTRQNHDTTKPEGMMRVAWMLTAWVYACNRAASKPTLDDAVALGRIIEPDKNELGLRTCGVFFRDSDSGLTTKVFPSPDKVPRLLALLFEQRDSMAPLDFYKAFEEIHPFVDGNGRVGKVLLNWVNGHGSLLDPFFPPADFFGSAIRNP
jgi:hypothetical protein